MSVPRLVVIIAEHNEASVSRQKIAPVFGWFNLEAGAVSEKVIIVASGHFPDHWAAYVACNF